MDRYTLNDNTAGYSHPSSVMKNCDHSSVIKADLQWLRSVMVTEVMPYVDLPSVVKAKLVESHSRWITTMCQKLSTIQGQNVVA